MTTALVFACYDRACRPPTSGGTGGSSPKKLGGEPYETPSGYAIQAANGKKLSLTFSTSHPPYGGVDEVWRTSAQNALRGLRRAYDAAPVDRTPQIVMGDFSTHAGFVKTYQDKIDRIKAKGETLVNLQTREPMTAQDMAKNTLGLTYGKDGDDNAIPKGYIGINASSTLYEIEKNDSRSKITMPEAREYPRSYGTAVHEYGHHRWHNGPDGRGIRRAETEILYNLVKDSEFMSDYGSTKPMEAHAEAFTAWALGGKTPVVEIYVDAFGWGEKDAPTFSLQQDLVLLEENFDPDDVVAIFDTEFGPFYLLTGGRSAFIQITVPPVLVEALG